jgi:ABC-type nickel/cobalt efflux system permease component RcnA
VLTVVYGGTGRPADFALAYLVGAAFGLVTAVACWFLRSADRTGRRAR